MVKSVKLTGEGNSKVGVGENSSNISVFSTDKIFVSPDELKKWAEKNGRENGVVIVTERTKKNAKGEVNKIFLMCDRGGVYKSTAKVKRSGTIKTDCPFQLVGKYHDGYGGWMLQVSRDAHNHELAQHMEGHSYAMRLTGEQKITIFQGESHIEVLFRHLDDKGYTHDFCKNPSTNAMEDLFFMHPTSYNMFRSFPHVLIIDTTYNTNVYKLPFVQIVGVTSTYKTITIALSFIAKEKEDNFRWVLTRLKKMLHECMMPRVILTYRDLALINACNVVFPDAAKLLCRWHISQNIKKHCKQSFAKGNNWEFFEELWSSVVFSPTPAAYEYSHKRLRDGLTRKHKRVFEYVNTNWLVKYKEMFVSA
ncbi:protein FAR1-RELATED SEQUENCE 2-like [Bidens hawaiensis]|uniref:protein FAR1-RELATED SEQUENCE 2-like n=1 Tax=Bidens hawaiensis TaxID=980011 RepID=UPI00404A7DE2